MVSNIILQLSQENVITGQDTTGFIVNKTALSTYVQTHDVLAILFDVNNGLTTTTYLRAVVNKWTFHDKVMGEQYISFTISAETPITWAIGDYCIFRGEVFTLNYLPSIAQKAGAGKSLESYNYDQVKMESRQEELTRCQLRDIVLTSGQHSASEGTNYTGSASFELFCGETTMVIGGQVVTRTAVCTLADRIQANLNAFYGDNVWTVLVDTTSTYIDATGQEVLVTHTENKKLTFDNNTVAEALAEVHNTFGLDYCVHGRTIYIGYDMGDVTANSSDEQFAFGYGQGYPTPSDEHKALFEIRKISDSSQKIVTRLRVLGSTKNLKYQYYFKKYNLPQALITTNLQLPDTFLPEGTRVNPDPGTKWANNAARLAAGLRAVQGAENDAYIEKNDDAPHCAEGIREATVKFDGSNKDLEEIYPSIEGVKYSDLRADTDIKDIDGNSGQNAFPNYGGDEVINQLLAIGYKHNGQMFDDANVGSGRLPDPNDTIIGIQNTTYLAQNTVTLTEGQDYYYGPETTLFSVQNVARGKYFMVPVVGKEPYFDFSASGYSIMRVGYIIRVKQTISGVTSVIAEYQSDWYDNIGKVVLPTIPDVFNMDEARVPDITVTAPSNTTAAVSVTFTPIILKTTSGITFNMTYSVRQIDGGSDSTYIWAPVSNVDSSNQPFHVFVKDMGFDIVAQFTSDATPKMVMKSGMCNGMEFQIGEAHEVITYDGKKGYMLTLYRADDTNLNTYYPSSGYQLTAGDEFVLTGIDLPDVYIEAAENRLLRAATIWLAENGDTRFKYQPSIDEIYLRRNYDNMVSAGTPEKSIFWRLYAGWKLKFTDIPSTNPDLEVMIESVSISMGDKITRKVDITLNDEPTQSTLKKTESNVKDLSTNVKALGSGMATLVTMDTLREYTDKNFVSKVKDDSKLGKLDIETDLNAGNDIKADRDVIGMRGVIAKGIGSMSMGGGGGNGTLTEIRINGTRIPDTSGVVNLPLAVGGNNGNDGAMSSADKDKLDGIAEHANNYVLPIASAGTLGGVRVGAGLSINASGVLSATYSLPLAANGTRGGVQIGYQSNGRNYAVELDGEKMFVNVPWTDTTYESKAASQGGTAVSLVTTGEKYTWNAKQDAIADLSTIRTQAGEGHTAYGYFSGGILPISAGGTGASTASAARTALGLGAAATYGVGSVAASNTGLVTGGDVYSAINSALTAAMKIEGETTTQISDGSTANPVVIGGQSVSAYKGMVVFYGSKEFVWVGTSWKELGDESSFAIKTTTITGTGYLSGGGDLSASRTIDIAQTIKDKIDTSYTNNHTHSNKSVLDDISSTKVSNWDTAYTNNHTHSNKSILDGIAGTAGTTYNLDTITSNISTLQGYFSNGSANTAVKLLNARTIWGQSFDGSANVSGAMSGVTNIDSLLYFDTTNARMGVGVSNPSDKFHVGGNVIANGGVAAKGIASMSMGGTGGGGTLTQIKVNNVALADVDGVVNIPLVTTNADGVMSSSDKSKLDGIAEHANNYTLPAATSGALGGIRLGYSASGKNYPVQLDGSNKAYVNVPWENTQYTFYNLAFQNASGTQVDIYKPTTSPSKTIKAGSNVTISAASNVITIAATDTTYSNGTGLDLSSGVFSINSTYQTYISNGNTAYGYFSNGVLPASKGGTGKTTLSDAGSAIINALGEGSSPATRNDYIVAQYAGGGTTTTTYHRRKLSNIFAALNSSDITTALGYTPFNNASFTQSNIKSTLGISDWALTSSKPSYAFSEITGTASTSQIPTLAISKISGLQTALDNKLETSLKGAANGLAELDANGLVPSSQLPSYVDDVLEYASKSAFPSTGTSGKIYVALDTNLTYRWSGTAYVEISPSLALGETSSTAYRGDRGKTAYDHATETKSGAQNSGFYKFSVTAQGHISGVSAVASSDLTTLIGSTTYAPYNSNGYLPLNGGIMTGAIKRKYSAASDDPVINVASVDKDIWIWRVSDSDYATSAKFGYGLKYLGTGGGNDNALALFADNQQSTQIKAVEIKQDGTISLAVTPNVNGTNVSLVGHTHNYAGSSSSGGAATSANKLNTDAGSATTPVYFSNGVPVACTAYANASVNYATSAGTATKLGSSNVGSNIVPIYLNNGTATAVTALDHSYVAFTGRNLSGSTSVLDKCFEDRLKCNSLAAIVASNVTIERSTDGGSTWTDAGYTDADKLKLFRTEAALKVVGSGSATTSNQLRITINTERGSQYINFTHLLIYLSTNGAAMKCEVSTAPFSAPTTFTVLSDVGVSGWTGWNSMNATITAGGYSGDTRDFSKYIRFRFYITGTSTQYDNNFSIKSIRGFGGWDALNKNNLAYWGRVYNYDQNLNTSFPAGVSATSFTENGTALSSKYLGINANAVSATKLATARTIWGQSFDGSANVSGAMSGVTNIDSLLYFDTTNARMGVGVSNPSDKFHVGGNVIANGGVAAKGIASMSMNGGGGAAGAVTQINVGSTPYAPTDGIVTLPSSYPASDVSAWAKASTRPAYNTSIATSSGTNQRTLEQNTKYALSAGDTSYIFTTPKTEVTFSTTTLTSSSTSVYLNNTINGPTFQKINISSASYGGQQFTINLKGSGSYYGHRRQVLIFNNSGRNINIMLGGAAYKYISSYLHATSGGPQTASGNPISMDSEMNYSYLLDIIEPSANENPTVTVHCMSTYAD